MTVFKPDRSGPIQEGKYELPSDMKEARFDIVIDIVSLKTKSGPNDVGIVVPAVTKTLRPGDTVRFTNMTGNPDDGNNLPTPMVIWFPRTWDEEDLEILVLEGRNYTRVLTVGEHHFSKEPPSQDYGVPFQVFCSKIREFAVGNSPPKFIINAP